MFLLGLDNGSTMIKAGIFDVRGKERAVHQEKISVRMPAPGFYERDMSDIWQSNVRAIKGVLKKAGIQGEDIGGIAVTGHGNGIHFLDARGNPVGYAIESSDARASEYVATWYRDGTFEQVFPKIRQNLWAAQFPPLLAWFRDHQPALLKKAGTCFLVKDYVRFKLTGNIYTEMTDISGTGLLDVVNGCYDDELFEAFGLESTRALLPEIKKSDELCGHVSAHAAGETGLKAGTPVAGGVFDIDAAGLATGLEHEEKMNVIAGTWCNNQYICTTPPADKNLFMVSRYALNDHWLVLEGSPTSASNFEWFVTEFLPEAKAQLHGGNIYDWCNQLVETTTPQDANIVFIPYLYGSHSGKAASATFLGMKGHHTRAQMIRAMYEGIVFSHKTHINKLLNHREPPQEIRIAGGAANSELWVQMFADVLNVPIAITEGTELGALGAAICAGVVSGDFGSLQEGMSAMVHTRAYTKPKQEYQEIYQAKFERFKKAIMILEEYWKDS
jgi:L-xylulokinase